MELDKPKLSCLALSEKEESLSCTVNLAEDSLELESVQNDYAYFLFDQICCTHCLSNEESILVSSDERIKGFWRHQDIHDSSLKPLYILWLSTG